MLYGRDDERARLGALLEAARASRSGALLIRGEPGIGKSALLDDTQERAPDMHALRARGVESESELPYAALHQLLRPALAQIDRIPAPQAAALRAALGLAQGANEERFLVFAACLSLLSELAERRPVLCLVDDAHWLDAASGDALRFVSRRLDAEGIALVLAARDGEPSAFDGDDIPSLRLGGLGDEAAAALLSRGAGVDAAPAVRRRLVERTKGNALALIELPSVLTRAQLAGDEPLPDALPMTSQVESVFLERVRRLPDEAQRLLLLAAADDLENVAVVARAAELCGLPPEALDAAEHAGLLSVHGPRLEFRHPLVRSAVYEAATSTERRTAHRVLAEAFANPDEHVDRRAWHLAAAALEPDEQVVSALEEAAGRAESRGGYVAAAKALERAAQLSADPADRGRRLVAAARSASMAGAHEYATAVARQALPLVSDPVNRGDIAQVLAAAEIQRGRPLDVVRPLVEAARDAAPVDGKKALELLVHAFSAGSDGGDLDAQDDIATLAAEVVGDDPDEWSQFVVHFLSGVVAMVGGDTARGTAILNRALAWAVRADDPGAVYWASAGALWVGDDSVTETLATRAAALARARGALAYLAGALGVLGSHLFLAQRFEESELAAAEALQLNRELGFDNYALLALAILASNAAVHGRDDEARRHAEEALELATARGLQVRAASARRALSLVALARGRWAEALEQLDALSEIAPGHSRPFVALMAAPDRVEAAVRTGERDKALDALATFETWAESSDALWAHARLASARALVLDGEDATEEYEQALRLADEARPFDVARIHLLYGEHLRRARRRTDARVQLRAALDRFERLDAEPWAARTHSALRATGETARKRDPSTINQLTPQELQIARHVAEGMSNKEIAALLFLSPRTIDSHLRNIFGKLDITSRIQLARMPLGRDLERDAKAGLEASG